MSDEDKPRILTGKELAAEVESLRKLCGDAKPVSMEEVRRILSKCGSLSGEIIKERRGGDMWEDLKKWLIDEMIKWAPIKDNTADDMRIALTVVQDRMIKIEKEYGVE